ncbi:haloalkanoic acid dehalogenase, partial [Stereum hirsutum FP-91666 SS1]|uniref:haloalkanoic acid dehalogenase n=1 Tax=Stereum hirsutum (strain FP-91666) TaxID=721885 RepID=UPI000440D0F7
KLTQFKAIIFDVYGTLIDRETGIHRALLPLLSSIPSSHPSRTWPLKDLLTAVSSVEHNLEAQFPNMLYTDVLANTHAELAKRLGRKRRLEAMDREFAESIKDWPVFGDTNEALRSLSTHFKLIVLSNVDRFSFAHTHKILSMPPSSSPSIASPGSDPSDPFSLIITAQDAGAYKPSLLAYNYALDQIQEKLGVRKDEVLVVAQSLMADHVPANELGIPSVWIDRQGACMGKDVKGVKWMWKFETLGEMAEAVE